MFQGWAQEAMAPGDTAAVLARTAAAPAWTPLQARLGLPLQPLSLCMAVCSQAQVTCVTLRRCLCLHHMTAGDLFHTVPASVFEPQDCIGHAYEIQTVELFMLLPTCMTSQSSELEPHT